MEALKTAIKNSDITKYDNYLSALSNKYPV